MPVPQDLLDKLNNAEDLLGKAKAADGSHDQAAATLATAQEGEGKAAADALAAHQAANQAATDALAAVKAHFGA
jgi:hypothetical protein